MVSSLVAWFFYPTRPRRTIRRGPASLVIVEALTRLAAEVAGRHVVAQQRARPILVLAEARVQALEDRERALERRRHEDHPEIRLSRDLGDPSSHLPGADDA